MNDPPPWTLLVGMLSLGFFDFWLTASDESIISPRLRIIGRRLSFLPYACGAAGGHFWGPHFSLAPWDWLGGVTGLLLGGMVLSLAHSLMLQWVDPPDWWPLVYLPCGAMSGVFFWPQ